MKNKGVMAFPFKSDFENLLIAGLESDEACLYTGMGFQETSEN